MPDCGPPPLSRSAVDRGRLLVLASALLWSLAGVFIKVLDVPPLTIVLYRSLFASLVFLPFIKRSDWRLNWPVVVSVVCYSAALTAFVSANKLTTAANAIVLQYTAPVFVLLYSRIVLGETISKLTGLAFGLSMAGVGIISLDSAGEPEITGVLVALLSGLFFAGYMVNLQRTKTISPVYLTWLNNFMCALILLPIVKSRLALSPMDGMLLAVMGAVQLGLPYYLFSKGLRSVSLQEASLIALIEPVLNPLWVAAVIGEIPSAATIAGGGMIVVGLASRYVPAVLGKYLARVPPV
jgi:drug/metabolite transporter (DMT)-like permease